MKTVREKSLLRFVAVWPTTGITVDGEQIRGKRYKGILIRAESMSFANTMPPNEGRGSNINHQST